MARNAGFISRRTALVAAIAGASLLAAFPAASQQVAAPYTPAQCDQIRNNILGIFNRYEGKISPELVADLKEFSKKDCDRTVHIRMIPGTQDRDALGELKVLISSRLSSNEGPR
jgi:hypothetical protein